MTFGNKKCAKEIVIPVYVGSEGSSCCLSILQN